MDDGAFMQLIVEAANRETYMLARARAMGFKFAEREVYDTNASTLHAMFPKKPWHPKAYEIRGSMKCVCGQIEHFRLTHEFSSDLIEASSPGQLRNFVFADVDVGERLHEIGSFSAEHLRRDGYTEEQIAEIIRKGDEFDNSAYENVLRKRDPNLPPLNVLIKHYRMNRPYG